MIRVSENLYDSDVEDPKFKQFVRDNHHKTFDSRFILKENIPLSTKQSFVRAAIPADMGEVLGGSSPNQIGSSIVAWSRHLMNLVMVPLLLKKSGSIMYTDTDSLSITEEMYDHIREVNPTLINEMGTTMGTFKNDHSHIFKNGRVLFSALGGKKVKLHLLGCPDTGKLHICNTFKGYMVEGVDNEGKRFSKDRADHSIASSLLQILYHGKPDMHLGTRWTRSMNDGGVRIEKGVEFQPTSEAYLGHCEALHVLPPPNPFYGNPYYPDEKKATLIACVPHGCEKSLDESTVFRFNDETEEEKMLPDAWRTFINYRMDPKGRISEKSLFQFLDRYYSEKNEYYQGSENRDEWTNANEVITFTDDRVEEGKGKEKEDSNEKDAEMSIDELFSDYRCSPFLSSEEEPLDFGNEETQPYDEEFAQMLDDIQ